MDIQSAPAPKYEFVGEFFYCDGVRVPDWALTEAEIIKFVPKDKQDRFIKAIAPNPIQNKKA